MIFFIIQAQGQEHVKPDILALNSTFTGFDMNGPKLIVSIKLDVLVTEPYLTYTEIQEVQKRIPIDHVT